MHSSQVADKPPPLPGNLATINMMTIYMIPIGLL